MDFGNFFVKRPLHDLLKILIPLDGIMHDLEMQLVNGFHSPHLGSIKSVESVKIWSTLQCSGASRNFDSTEQLKGYIF